MVTSLLLFILGALSVAATTVSLFRVRHPIVLVFPIMMTGWLTSEWALFHIAAQMVLVAVLIWLDGLDGTLGQIGAPLFVISWIGLIVVWVVTRRARPTARAALAAGLGEDYLERVPAASRERLRSRPERGLTLRPLSFNRSGLTIDRNISYGEHPKRNLLDVYRPAEPPAGKLPVVLQIHGGAWIIGNKVQQAQPLLHRLAANGYVAVSINYRLAPKVRFPEPLIDVKRAIAWVRTHIGDYGGDPSTIIVTGGSAGGHLSSLATLTANQAEYQPGFESIDTSVAACVPFYGPSDFRDRHAIRGRLASMEPFLKRAVMPGARDDFPELWDAMSPIAHVHPEAPPFFIIQGHLDALVWREETRLFADELAAVSGQPVAYWEVPGAQHAFDTFNSWRSAAAVDAVERFAGWVAGTRQTATSSEG